MTTLEILGKDWTGDGLWVRFDDPADPDTHEVDVVPVDLAVARRSVQRGYSARLHGHWLDESQLDTLIAAMDAPQRFWPPVICREGDCGAEASVRIEGEPYCHGHAQGYTAREEGQ